MVELAEGACGFLTGRWATGSARCDRAIEILRDQCTGTSWEMGQASTYMLWCMSWEGRFGEMSKRTSEILLDARDKGDLNMAANLGSYMAPLAHLTVGEVDAAKKSLTESMSDWSREEYNIQHMTALMGAASVHLYAREYSTAHERMVAEWKDLRRSLILHAEICRVVLPELRVRSALAAYFHEAKNPRHLSDAAKFIQQMGRVRVPYSEALAAPLRAGLMYVNGDRAGAVAQLGNAVRLLEAQGMGLFAAAARYRYGQLVNDGSAEDQKSAALEWMNSVGIKNPVAMIAAYTPYFENQ
jgi:eukaryotic-like serine/threonine-protein kinase